MAEGEGEGEPFIRTLNGSTTSRPTRRHRCCGGAREPFNIGLHRLFDEGGFSAQFGHSGRRIQRGHVLFTVTANELFAVAVYRLGPSLWHPSHDLVVAWCVCVCVCGCLCHSHP